MKCPKCKTELSIDLDITGGCECRSFDGKGRHYCYCPSQDVNVVFIVKTVSVRVKNL